MADQSQEEAKICLSEIILESSPTMFWDVLKQIGVEEVTGILPRSYPDFRQWRADDPWDYVSLLKYKLMLEDYGFRLTVIEDNPPMDQIIYGSSGKEEQLENIIKLIENMGKLKIPIWCYNWMPTGWIRTRTTLRGRGGSFVSGFDIDDVKDSPPPKFGKIDAITLWKNLKEFINVIVPIAESSNVKLAMHPDDPPIEEIQGTARIMNSVESFQKLIDLYPSEYNGITFCQGNFALMTKDLPAIVKYFLERNRISFVHFRDVVGDKYSFKEIFIDESMMNTYGCMKEYVSHEFYGPFRVDHTPTLAGDIAQLSMPGYSVLGRIHAIGYLQGLFKAAVSEINKR
jgi:mannonate dehydratase